MWPGRVVQLHCILVFQAGWGQCDMQSHLALDPSAEASL